MSDKDLFIALVLAALASGTAPNCVIEAAEIVFSGLSLKGLTDDN